MARYENTELAERIGGPVESLGALKGSVGAIAANTAALGIDNTMPVPAPDQPSPTAEAFLSPGAGMG
jgi:hypothetical protein